MRKTKTGTFLKQKSYVIAAVIMLAAVFGMTGIYYSQQSKEQEEQLAKEQQEKVQQAKAEDEARAKAAEEAAREKALQQAEEETQNQKTEAVSGIIPPKQQEPQEAAEMESQTEGAPQVQELHFDAAQDLGWPLQGNVIMNYSMDQTVYFATLDQYKYNPAVVIQADVNTPVNSVAQGQITALDTNEETGVTMTVDLGDNYSAVYGQLKDVSLNAGDYVEAGQVLGYVGEPTKYYSLEGTNLYFQLLKDGEPVDPMEYLQ